MKYLVVLCVLAAGCATPTDIGTTREAIVNGTVDTSAHDAVVLVLTADVHCTGTMIAPNLVLTARHCVSNLDADQTVCNADGTSTGGHIQSDRDPTTMAITGGVGATQSNVLTALGTALIVDSATTICHDDIAFLVLATNTTLPYVPVAHASVTPGEEVTLVGYGLTGVAPANAEAPVTAPAQRMVRTGVPIVAVGTGTSFGAADVLGASEFSTGEGDCEGDSGGPAFEPDGSVVGAVSHGEGTCTGATAVTVFTDVTKYGDLTSRAFVAAGYPASGPPAYVAPPAKDDDSGCNESGRSSRGPRDVMLVVAALSALRRASRARASRPCRARSAAAR